MKFLNKALLVILAGLFTYNASFGQDNKDYKYWSETQKLTIEDFGIKTRQLETSLSYAQFTISYSVNGFDFLTRNFNKKVRNGFIGAASWIDTSTSVQQSLTYQQTLFDICEIYCRQFRQALRLNRKKIAKGYDFIEGLNNQYMADFAKRRIVYDRETKSGSDEAPQKVLEIQIKKELQELKDFAYEK